MLRCCEKFANKCSLQFNPTKIKFTPFACSLSSFVAHFIFCGQQPCWHSHIATKGILFIMVWVTSKILITSWVTWLKKPTVYNPPFLMLVPLFWCVFQTYPLPLYCSALWPLFLSCPLSDWDSFNKVLQRIWQLPSQSHTGVIHFVANLHSLYNLC